MPKVSVVIPCFNQEKYVSLCLDSVLSQSLFDIEVLCINDGSTDGTLEILNHYAATDKRVCVITQHNQGAAACRNLAINKACGEYIIFCDSDDVYPSSQVLERLYHAGVDHNAKAIAGSYSIFDESKNEIQCDFDELLWGQKFEKEGFFSFRDYQFDYGFTRFMFHLNEVKESGITFSSYSRFEDPPFLVAMLGYVQSFYAITDIVYQARTGYKSVNWTSSAQIDLLKGLSDNLRYSRINHLDRLHELTVRRIEEEYFGVYYWSLVDERVFSELVRANSEVAPEMLGPLFKDRISEGFLLLKPLAQQVDNARKWGQDIEDLQSAVLAERSDKERGWSEIDSLKAEISDIRNSRTWKIAQKVTSPLRWARNVARYGKETR